MRDARTPLRDYAAEADIRSACDRAGVLESAQADFVDEFRAGAFTRKDIDEHIATCRTTKPQRWVIAGTEDDDLFVSAFGPTPSITDQGTVLKKYGAERAAAIAAQFGVTIGTGKPGKVPDTIKTDSSNAGNPFLHLRDATGKVDEAQAAKVDSLIKKLGTKKAEAIARSVGKSITGLALAS